MIMKKSLIIYSLLIAVAFAARYVEASYDHKSLVLKSSNPVDIFSGWINGIMTGLGVPKWGELMIGFAIGTPIQGIKLFLPYECPKSILDLMFEGFNFFIFYEQMLFVDQDKYFIYMLQSLLSMTIEVPQILHACLPNQPNDSISSTLAILSDSIFAVFETLIYVDTSVSLVL